MTDKIQIMQTRPIKLTLSTPNYIKTKSLFMNYIILDINNTNKYQTAIFMYKYAIIGATSSDITTVSSSSF